MRVLVTGGAGFIGGHLCRELLQLGYEVAVLDNFSTGSRANVGSLMNSPRFRLYEEDVRNASGLSRILELEGAPDHYPDVVFHLAAAVGVRNILDHPLESLETNLNGTENVLAAVAGWGGRVVITSTSEVYGKNDAGALSEDADRVLGAGDVARWWYAVAKMADEALALAYHRESRLKATVVRLFNTVGPRQSGRYGMVLPTLVRQALAGEPLTVFGDGEQTRCFTYVLDTVRALIALAETESAYGRIFNIGQQTEISINGLAECILRLTDSPSEVTHVPYAEAYGGSFEDMRRRVPDCARLLETVGFAPTDRLEEAILAVVEELKAAGVSTRPSAV